MYRDIQRPAKLAKRCPCCGSAEIVTDAPDFYQKNNLYTVSIVCANCGMMSAVHGEDFNDGYRKALKVWNRRRRAAA